MTVPRRITHSPRVGLGDMVRLDHQYVADWSPRSDVGFSLRTVTIVVGRRGL